jgi:hypothetical protein
MSESIRNGRINLNQALLEIVQEKCPLQLILKPLMSSTNEDRFL